MVFNVKSLIEPYSRQNSKFNFSIVIIKEFQVVFTVSFVVGNPVLYARGTIDVFFGVCVWGGVNTLHHESK